MSKPNTRTKVRVNYGLIVDPKTGREYREGDDLRVNLLESFWTRRQMDKSISVVVETPVIRARTPE